MGRTAMILMVAGMVALTAAQAGAQKLAIGARAPELSVSEWLTDKPSDGRPRLINFFHTSSGDAVSALLQMDGFARDYSGRLEVIVIGREAKEKVRAAAMNASRKYFVALDEGGKTFANFGVKFVPFSVVTDGRGKVLWFGNPNQLDKQALDKLLK